MQKFTKFKITPQRRWCSQSTIVSEGFKGGTRGAPIMPRDAVSRTVNVERTGRHKWVNITQHLLCFSAVYLWNNGMNNYPNKLNNLERCIVSKVKLKSMWLKYSRIQLNVVKSH